MSAPAETSTGTNNATPAGEKNAPAHGRPTPPRRRRKRGRKVAAAVVATVVVAAGVTYVVVADPFQKSAPATTIDNGSATGVSQVTKGDLSSRTMQNGTLGFGGEYKVVNQSSGTLTRVPNVGDVIKQGKIMYRLDGKAVIFLQGASPVYRAMARGDKGADVRQLNKALIALGYADSDDLDASSTYFGYQTYYAVRRMQDALNLEVTGEVALGQVLFLPPKQLRVTEVAGTAGTSANPNQAVLTVSSTDRVITVELTASQQSTVKAGDDVTITLPTGKSTPGKVASVGKVAVKDSEGNVTITVSIKPLKPADTGSLDKAPVQVAIVSDTVKNVLSVPVNALLALAGGGYAVETVDAAGARKLVAVKVGMFDDSEGRVEVTGTGLTEGQNVVVPAS